MKFIELNIWMVDVLSKVTIIVVLSNLVQVDHWIIIKSYDFGLHVSQI